MLFFIDGNFIEVLRESCYKGILTFCSPSRKALIGLKSSTMGEPVRLAGQAHKWALHVPEDQAPDFIDFALARKVEEVDRLTGPALAFAYDFVLESSLESEGTVFGDYGYCWPDEVQDTHRRLFECDDPASGEVFFVPIWTLPDELTGAPRQKIESDSEDD
jgi:hypothetical protein